MKASETVDKIEFLAKEFELFNDELSIIKLNHRADVDELTLQIETIKVFLARMYPDFDRRFETLAKEVQYQVDHDKQWRD